VASKADGDKRIALSVIVFPPEMNVTGPPRLVRGEC
jgi:hypothetical protein